MFLLSTPNPFGLPAPTAAWQSAIAGYDPDLRLMPSQSGPFYRLMRLARHTGSINPELWRKKGMIMSPDTATAFDLRVVPITTLQPAAVIGSPIVLLAWLKDHDIEAHGGADAVADRFDERDRRAEEQLNAVQRDELGVRSRASRVGWLYRTGARVSLVGTHRRNHADAFLSHPTTPTVAAPATPAPVTSA